MISINEIFGFSKLIPLTSNTLDQESLHKKKNFSIKDFFSKCDQIHRFLRGKLHFLRRDYSDSSKDENFASLTTSSPEQFLKNCLPLIARRCVENEVGFFK